MRHHQKLSRPPLLGRMFAGMHAWCGYIGAMEDFTKLNLVLFKTM
jgi:hypothetical protein